MALKEISVEALSLNPMTRIGQQWMLVTAGNEEHGFNTMTAAWGHMGAIWDMPGKRSPLPTALAFVRPQRYTKEFLDREGLYSLSFFDESWRKQLAYLGRVSGREENKIENAGLTPVFGEGTTWFAEAELVLVCRKLYGQELKEDCFVDQEIMERNYPLRDFHTMYIGEIIKVLVRE